jgi:hypothetical protein
MPLTVDYQLHDILYRACGCTTQSSDSASSLELDMYNDHERSSLARYPGLGWDYTIDVYDR